MATEQKVKSTPGSTPFADMDLREKLAFAGKACVFFLRGGFIHPNFWRD